MSIPKKIFSIVLIFSVLMIFVGCSKEVDNEEIVLQFNGEEIDVVFTGTLKNKMPEGKGSFFVNNEDGFWSFEGEFAEGTVTGIGELKDYPCSVSINGIAYEGIYTGSTDCGILIGNGKFVCEKDDIEIIYDGSWENGEISGDGTITNLPLNVPFTDTQYNGNYTGKTKDGLPDGDGIFTYINEEINIKYEGGWKQGKPSGKGYLENNNFVIKFKEANRTGEYKGNTENGIACGEGTYMATNDDGITYTYTGTFANNTFNGYGECTFDDGTNSKGDYTNGEYTPKVGDYVASYIQDVNSMSISDENIKFMNENENLFPTTNLNDVTPYLGSYNYLEYSKNPTNYEKLLIDTGKLSVMQIYEYQVGLSNVETYTYMTAIDENGKIYSISYFGKLDSVLEYDIISVKGLPISYYSYDNMGGGKTFSIALVGSYIVEE